MRLTELSDMAKWIKPESMANYDVTDASIAINTIFANGNNVDFCLAEYVIKSSILQKSKTKARSLVGSIIVPDTVTTPSTIYNIRGNSIEIEGIKIDGKNVSTNGFYSANSKDIVIRNCTSNNFINFNLAITLTDNVLIEGCTTIKSANQGGIAVANNCHHIIVQDNIVSKTGAYGIIAEDHVYDIKILRNKISDVYGTGIGVVATSGAPANNSEVADNIVIDVAYEGVLVLDSANVLVKNNTLDRGTNIRNSEQSLSTGIRFGQRIGNSKVIGNTVKGFLLQGLNISSNDSADVVAKDNSIVNCGINTTSSIIYSGLNNLYDINNISIGTIMAKNYTSITKILSNDNTMKKALGPTYPVSNTSDYNINLALNLYTLFTDTYGVISNSAYNVEFEIFGFDGARAGMAVYKMYKYKDNIVFVPVIPSNLVLSGTGSSTLVTFPSSADGQWYKAYAKMTLTIV